MNLTIDNSITQSVDTQSEVKPAMAVQLLKEGNKRFVSGNKISRNLNKQVIESAQGQYPFAAIVGCIDSRVPAEIVFDQGIGDVFNVRIAGNFVNTDILGSLEFSCVVAGSKAIVVMGHSHCGAIKGACDNVELGNLTHMLSNLKPAVDSISGKYENPSSKNHQFVQEVANNNVKFTIEKIRKESEALREMEKEGEIIIVGAMYDVETGKVEFFD
ncbi:carbonic anhydrase family protein [Labilibacter marinus]|uniref:carbonic anhydrase family protein n=1 Tax=Labilibacter marinus TaxID=1477105 RepID=UPI00094FABDA|nr:carbonic anhydrase family protein [Labilibacter marinus]